MQHGGVEQQAKLEDILVDRPRGGFAKREQKRQPRQSGPIRTTWAFSKATVAPLKSIDRPHAG